MHIQAVDPVECSEEEDGLELQPGQPHTLSLARSILGRLAHFGRDQLGRPQPGATTLMIFIHLSSLSLAGSTAMSA